MKLEPPAAYPEGETSTLTHSTYPLTALIECPEFKIEQVVCVHPNLYFYLLSAKSVGSLSS